MHSKDTNKNFALLKEKILRQGGKDYWRSVEEFVDAPEFEEFVKEEYPSHAEEWDNSFSRRNFLKVMGASLALAGISGCVIQPAEYIVPYVKTPEGTIPGKPQFFASGVTLGGVTNGILCRSTDGRPTKVEGNPESPSSLGATDIYSQASLLGLYDPDRSENIRYRGKTKTWNDFLVDFRSKISEFGADGGSGIHFLSETIGSPTIIDQFSRLKSELPNASWHQFEPASKDNSIQGATKAFGEPAHAVYSFDKASRVLSLDADIFSGFNVRYIKDFAKARSVSGEDTEMNRLYSIETTLSLTGSKADHRLAVKPSQMAEVAKAVAAAVGVGGVTSNYTENAEWIAEMAKDLQANQGKSIVVAGDNQSPLVHAIAYAINDSLGNIGQTIEFIEPLAANTNKSQKEQLSDLIKAIDSGSVKMLVVLEGNPVYNSPIDLKINKERMDKIPYRVHLGQYFDETAALCHWHIPSTHFLETWGDGLSYDGSVTLSQPLIDPLYNGKSVQQIVQLCFKENYEKSNLDIVKGYWQEKDLKVTPIATSAPTSTNEAQQSDKDIKETSNEATPKSAAVAEPIADAEATPKKADIEENESSPKESDAAKTAVAPASNSGNEKAPITFEDNWRKAIHDGFIAGSKGVSKSVSVNPAFMSEQDAVEGEGRIEIAVLPDPCVFDGRYSNNGWLQELPNPLTKITWENVALISPATARRLGINQTTDSETMAGGDLPTAFVSSRGGNMVSDLLEISYKGNKIPENVPAWVSPGQPDDVVTIYLGYGRERAGKVGTGIGYNAYAVRSSDAMWFAKGDIKNTGSTANVASTQIHFNMEGRDLLRNWSLEEYEEKLKEEPENPEELYKKSIFGNEFGELYAENQRWAMSIDLNSCVGCNACVLACQSENNIPVVGKEQVERSREMHWMRVDAYYSGEVDNPDGPYFQPVLCQQCEQAPCEVVCPVHATAHSAEGLNDMVYNRCIGTRYCSNNCPYKVRRFNFMLYQDWDTPQYKLMRNPEVTVRSRGVMEKCTYCTQRISMARIEAQKDGRNVRDGEIVTACQSVCPADAIEFGDLNDKESKVAKKKADHRNYALLNEELNTQPRTSYLAGIRNQNPSMPDYRKPDDSSHSEAH